MTKAMINPAAVAIVLLTSSWLASGCAGIRAEQRSEHDRRLVEATTRPFNPAYFKDETRRHRAIPFDIVNGELELSARSIEERPGPLPYRPPGAGSVVVIYKDAQGRTLGRYAIPDPTGARSCDLDNGKIVGEVKRIEEGKVDLLVPVDDRIVQIEVSRKPKRFELSEKLKEVMKVY